jgi:bacterioferritin-associated ferredoxin
MDPCCTPDRCQDCSERLICRCLQIREAELITALTTRDIRTIQDVRQHTGAGDGCTACHGLLRKYIERYAYSSAEPICSVK